MQTFRREARPTTGDLDVLAYAGPVVMHAYMHAFKKEARPTTGDLDALARVGPVVKGRFTSCVQSTEAPTRISDSITTNKKHYTRDFGFEHKFPGGPRSPWSLTGLH